MSGKLLLHVCCAPCLSGSIDPLLALGDEVTGYFFNPNIHPTDEFNKRIETLNTYSKAKNIKVVIDRFYDMELFEKMVAMSKVDRCLDCYRLRLKRTAKFAALNGFKKFSTTILISPHQKHEMVKQAGEEAAKEHGVEFIYQDLRPNYRDSVVISKDMGLYRQKYCGCYLSEIEAQRPKDPEFSDRT